MPSPVLNFTNTPPGSPADGDRYVCGTSPTGAWSGQANKYATYLASAWEFRTPIAGDEVFDQTAKKFKTYQNSAWSNLGFGVAYTFADSTARTATGTYYSEDVGKLAWQQSDDTAWLLKTVTSPGASATPTWVQVGGASSTITVKDIDGTPSVSANTIEFTNGTVTDQTGGVARVTIATGSVTVKEEDGSPSVAATEIKFPNASLTDNGGGSVSVAFPSASSDFALSISNQTIPTVTSGVLTGFSWRNQGACTATDRSPVGASFEYPTGSADSIRGMDKTAGSTIAEMWFRRVQASGASRMFLYARSSGGAYRIIGVNASGNLVVEVWTSDTGYTGTTGSSVTLTVNALLIGVRFTISGGNIDASYSLDGVFWYALATGISFTPAQFGVGIWSNGLTYGGVYSFYTA